MNGFMVNVAIILIPFSATPGDIEWFDNYGTALNSARTEKRPLLVVLENSTVPKGQLEQVNQLEDTMQNVLLTKYKLCRINAATPYGKQVAESFHVKKFPYTIVTDNRAKKIVYRHPGKFSSDDWGNTLAAYQNGKITRNASSGRLFGGESSQSSLFAPSTTTTPVYCPT